MHFFWFDAQYPQSPHIKRGGCMVRRIFSLIGICLWLTCVLASLPTGLNAQATNGVISGTVTDPSGAALPGATVQVKNVSTGLIRTVTTNEVGRYRVPDLLVGQYEVQATLSGFRTVVESAIPLSVGSERVIDFSLPIGQAQEKGNR